MSFVARTLRRPGIGVASSAHRFGRPEAQELAGAADGVLLLTKAGETEAKQVSDAMAALTRARANVVGLVLNQVRSKDAEDCRGAYHLDATDSFVQPLLNA